MNERVLGIVPVRSGSKRVPNKNLRTLGGKPLLAHAVEHAREAKRVDKVVCSSDDEEMRTVASEHGAEVPFERPARLATDDATNDQVVSHAIEWLENDGEQFDIVCVIPATAPFRLSDDIDTTIDALQQSEAHSVVSVTEYDAPPQWGMTLTEEGYLEPVFGDGVWGKTRTQEYQTLYHPNGAVFAADELAERVDFLSIGTNDLAQYVMAAARENRRVADLHDSLHPPVLRAIEKSVEAAHANDAWIGMCGEMAGNPALTELLVGLGLDELSMSAVTIPDVKANVSKTARGEAQALADRVLAAETKETVTELIEEP